MRNRSNYISSPPKRLEPVYQRQNNMTEKMIVDEMASIHSSPISASTSASVSPDASHLKSGLKFQSNQKSSVAG